MSCFNYKYSRKTREVAQLFGALAALAGDQGSFSSNHMAVYNSSITGSGTLFWAPQAPVTHTVHTHTYAGKHSYT